MSMNTHSSVLRAEKLSLARASHTLISSLDIEITPGQFWCVLGQNGVGKTSLLYGLSGLLQPSSGAVTLNGANISALSVPALAHKRGLMAQQQIDAFSNTVLDAVLIGRTPYRVGQSWDTGEDRAAAIAALQAVGMADKVERDVLTLSGGERQRVALATLLAQAPDVMLLDEPTSQQDVAQQLMMMRLVRDLSQKHAIIASCHDINLAARFSTHVLVLAKGRYWQGQVREVMTIEILQQAFDCRFEMAMMDGLRNFIAL